MRNLLRFSVMALITMAFWNPGTTLSAQGLPSGSYQQTCRNIGVNGSRLYATCQDGNGNWQTTELSDYQRCSSEIVNTNGTLQCNTTAGYNNDGYRQGGRDRDDDNRDRGRGQNGGPGASYVQTCRDIRTRGNTLEADCQAGNGQWNRTSLRNYNNCNGGIVNDGGTLRCGSDVSGYNNGGYYNGNRDRDHDNDNDRDRGGYQGGNYQNGVPGGSYTQTCQDIRISGNTLKANCQKGNGRHRQTSLRNFNQCSDIANENGNLRCK